MFILRKLNTQLLFYLDWFLSWLFGKSSKISSLFLTKWKNRSFLTCERLTTNTYLNTPFTECSTQKHYTKPLCEFKGYHVSKKLILISYFYKKILSYSVKYAKSVAVWILYYPGQKTFLRIIKTFQYVHTLSMLFVYHMWKLYMIRKVQK